MALHTLQSPVALPQCLPVLQAEDVLLLMDAAIYLADHGSALFGSGFFDRQPAVRVYALQSDLAIAGINQVHEQITAVDYDEWVRLTTQHVQHVAWY